MLTGARRSISGTEGPQQCSKHRQDASGAHGVQEKHVEEHLTIYSRANELEYRWAQLRMLFIREHSSELDEVVEFFSTAGRSQSYPFQVLEESVVQFLCDFKSKFARWAGGPAESALGRVNSGDSGRPEAREGTEKGSSGPSSGPPLELGERPIERLRSYDTQSNTVGTVWRLLCWPI